MKAFLTVCTPADTQAFYVQVVRADRPEEAVTNPVLVEAGDVHTMELPEAGQALIITAGDKVVVPMSMRAPAPPPAPDLVVSDADSAASLGSPAPAKNKKR